MILQKSAVRSPEPESLLGIFSSCLLLRLVSLTASSPACKGDALPAPGDGGWFYEMVPMGCSHTHPALLSLSLARQDRCLQEGFLGFSSNVRVYHLGCKTELLSLLFPPLSIFLFWFSCLSILNFTPEQRRLTVWCLVHVRSSWLSSPRTRICSRTSHDVSDWSVSALWVRRWAPRDAESWNKWGALL